MNKILYIIAVSWLFGAMVAQADEGYDPLMYDYDSEEEADGNLFSIIPPTPIKVGIKDEEIKQEQSNDIPPPANSEDFIGSEQESITIPPKPEAPQMIEPQDDSAKTPVMVSNNIEKANVGNLAEDNKQIAKTPTTTAPVPSPSQGTWIDSGLDIMADAVKPTDRIDENAMQEESLEGMMSNSRRAKKRANASVFDISGVMLRMTLAQVEQALKARKFTKVAEKFEIPNFIKWRNEEKCRNNGVVGYERLNSCVVSLSKQAGHQYPETVKYARFDTKEEIEVKLTSNFSNNKVYRIFYTSLAPSITGNSAKASYLRNIKVYDFWKKINRKYGEPDNKDEVIWGLGGNKPYLKASSGRLLLEDPMLQELDYTRMSREDQKFMNTELFNF